MSFEQFPLDREKITIDANELLQREGEKLGEAITELKQKGSKVFDKASRYAVLFGIATLAACGERKVEAPGTADSPSDTIMTRGAPSAEVDELTRNLSTEIFNSKDVRVGGLLYGIVDATDEHNDGAKARSDQQGELSPQGENIIIRGGTLSIIGTKDSPTNATMNTSLRSVFSISSTAPGYDVTPRDNPIHTFGYGVSKEDALKNAIESGVKQIEVTVQSESTLKENASDSREGASFETQFDERIQGTFNQAVDSYKVISSEQEEGPAGVMWKIQIQLQPGKIVETNDVPEAILRKPKD